MKVTLQVQVERFVDDHQPGFVACALIDAEGRRHEFIEKGPVVSKGNLWSDSLYPQAGFFGCCIEDEWTDKAGRRLVRVSTERPWAIESIVGETVFTVHEQQIVRA
ncbi:hypothetical protein [Duganella sp. HH101]|uniref:hypothetical protein n=1 Tax=Duganella sp. HH101 TaxID=1781066 RepID=UPI00114CFDF8|nr:hypothetical protein [Duganella sp. HH101]